MNESRQWSKLDNAAKIFPPTSSRRDTKVFRFSCELNESIEPAALQIALNRTLRQFPFYGSVLKKGLFWHYLEQANIEAVVREEYRLPCSPLYYEDKKSLLFEVTYFKNRINVEIYHALSDGAGALNFLRTLVFYYIKEKYKGEINENLSLDYDASLSEKRMDSFAKYYNGDNIKLSTNVEKAYHLRGERFPAYWLGVIEGRMPASEIIRAAKDRGLTMTELLSAVLIFSIHEVMSVRDERRPVSISIPVNLRSYFPTESARNFFSTIKVSHDFRTQGRSLEDIMANTKASFKAQLTRENIGAKMNSLAAWEHSVIAKLIPLMIKIYILKIINWFADKEVTATFSNLGRVDMPEETKKHIRLFDVFVSTKRLHICINTFGDILNISFTSGFVASDVQKHFFRTLKSMGVSKIEIVSNITETDYYLGEAANAM